MLCRTKIVDSTRAGQAQWYESARILINQLTGQSRCKVIPNLIYLQIALAERSFTSIELWKKVLESWYADCLKRSEHYFSDIFCFETALEAWFCERPEMKILSSSKEPDDIFWDLQFKLSWVKAQCNNWHLFFSQFPLDVTSIIFEYLMNPVGSSYRRGDSYREDWVALGE